LRAGTGNAVRHVAKNRFVAASCSAPWPHPFIVSRAGAAESLKAYSIWPENYARPMLEGFREGHRHPRQFHSFFIRRGARAVTWLKEAIRKSTLLFGGPARLTIKGAARAPSTRLRRSIFGDVRDGFRRSGAQWHGDPSNILFAAAKSAVVIDLRGSHLHRIVTNGQGVLAPRRGAAGSLRYYGANATRNLSRNRHVSRKGDRDATSQDY